jgi:HPt (histidine-containing phosphotransfer) domain-containing protein
MVRICSTRLFDERHLLERLGGDRKLLAEVIRYFQEESPGMLVAIGTALSEGDVDRVQRTTHALRGALLNISADGAAEIAHRLELSSQERELGAATRLLAELDAELGRLSHVLSDATEQGDIPT